MATRKKAAKAKSKAAAKKSAKKVVKLKRQRSRRQKPANGNGLPASRADKTLGPGG